MSWWTVFAIAAALWAGYQLGRATKTHAAYVRGHIEGYNAHRQEHVEAQRDAAARGLQ